MMYLRVSQARRLGSAALAWKQCRIHCGASSAGPVYSMHGAPIPCRTFSTADYPSLSADSQVRWRFPIDDKTEEMLMQVRHGILSQTAILTLNAATPLTQDLMEEALNILYDKVESLRICFRLRENKLWVADMSERVLDFKVNHGGNSQS
ncbi:hypothetical protein GWK47_042759 [Chionoecetes opilio]|uniref:Uncharacterized protein n=1 Tax=Chionoecetes opilio TaxID=41210 RepID=A0A8J4YC91_CHIOP|nr:hypothetical protein GWK47_047219 [Chionoecetes opilio]KAG0723434.1 hypothetical protein GWK47_042759 [Chionoecetes opilio]